MYGKPKPNRLKRFNIIHMKKNMMMIPLKNMGHTLCPMGFIITHGFNRG